MTVEEYNKARPNEQIVYQDEKVVIRVKSEAHEKTVYIHNKSNDGHEQLPLGYILGNNCLIHKVN